MAGGLWLIAGAGAAGGLLAGGGGVGLYQPGADQARGELVNEVIKDHGGWSGAFRNAGTDEASAASGGEAVPFRPRTVDPEPEERYVSCVPLIPLEAAAGASGDPQHIQDGDFEWVRIQARHRLREGMFVAKVVGRSMEPQIPNGSYCLFRGPVEGSRHGKTVLVQLRGAVDPDTGQRYTVKRYRSKKTGEDDTWRHTKIVLEPINPEYELIVLTGTEDGEPAVIAELVEVLSPEAFALDEENR